MEVHYYGQSCFEIDTGQYKLLFDPFISENPLAKDIVDISTIRPDYILLSHAHFDHVLDAPKIAKLSKAKLISNYEIIEYYGKQGLDGHPINHGGKWDFDFGTVKYVVAQHTSSFADGTYGGEAGGFVIKSLDRNFYFAGDTALTYDMKLIPETMCSLDFAILPIGDNFTMGYEDAIVAAQFIQCDTIIAAHYDTFPYIVVDHEAVEAAFEKAGKRIYFIEIGKSMTL